MMERTLMLCRWLNPMPRASAVAAHVLAPRCIESLEGIHVRHQGAERQHGDERSQKDAGELSNELLAGVGSPADILP